MRNDAHNDTNELPGRNSERIEPKLDTSAAHSVPILDTPLITVKDSAPRGSNKAVGVLSALTIAIICSAAAFGWWSMQRMQLLEQQLVATQNSFSKISEDAAGRINAITGKVSATENSVLSGNEALKERLSVLESSSIEKHKQQQIHLDQQSTDLSKISTELKSLSEHTNRLDSALAEQKTAVTQQEKTLANAHTDLTKKHDTQQAQLLSLEENLATNQQQLTQLSELKSDLNTINTQLATLQKNISQNDDITRLQQDILILRSELEQRAPSAATSTTGPSLADFDAYRAQTNRTISALQEQIRNLQKNTP